MAYVAKITAGGNTGMLVGSSLYGECTTADATIAKVVTISGFDTLITGVTIHVKFSNINTASSPTLNVSSTGAKAIKCYGTIAVGNSEAVSWSAGAVISLTYDGTNWIMNDYHQNIIDASKLTGIVPITHGGTGNSTGYVTAGQKSGTTLGTQATAEGYMTTASVNYTHAEGHNTTASGQSAHAEGQDTTASGTFGSHAEGYNTTASGQSAHAEGRDTTASGHFSHAEGQGTTASANGQHVFGKYNVANTSDVEIVGWGTSSAQKNIRTLDTNGNMTLAGTLTLGAAPTTNMDAATKQYVDAHYVTAGQISTRTLGTKATAEGLDNSAEGDYSHAEGNVNVASGICSHAEGAGTESSGLCSHTEGNQTIAAGKCSHAEGDHTIANGDYQHVFGKFNVSDSSNVEIVGWGTGSTRKNIRTLDTNGNMTLAGKLTLGAAPTANMDAATKQYVDAHYVTAGQKSGTTLGTKATAEGYNTTASESRCHAEGYNTTASEVNAHAEGSSTTASGMDAHAEGSDTTASGNYSHAEGAGTKASNGSAHAEGSDTTASGTASHAEGYKTTAAGHYSHAEGFLTIANGENQHVFGKYNVADTNNVEIVGWGTSSAQKNIRTLATNGNMTIAGTLTQSSDARLKDVQGEVPNVSGIRAVRFKWNDVNGKHDDTDHIGYLAQEVETVAPFLVKDDSNGYKSLDYIAFLCAKVEMLEREVEKLKQNKDT